jgi:hypothetical protein
MHLLAERFVLFFLGDDTGFSERGSQGLSNGTNVASQLANFFSVFTSEVYVNNLVAIYVFKLHQDHTARLHIQL